MAGYTTTDLLSSVKDRAMLPDASTGSLSSATLLQFATEELQGPILKMILSAREQFYATYSDQAVVANQAAYAIPVRAAGGIVGVVQYIYLDQIYNLTPLDPSGAFTTTTALYPSGFYFQNNSIVLFPTPNAGQGTLRMRYFQRPSRLAVTSDCTQVVSFDANAITVTVSAAPSTWTTNTVVDFVSQTIPYAPYGLDTTLTGVASNVLSMAALPTGITVGDWVAPAGFTPIPELPYEFFHILAQATACKALEAIGDQTNLPGARSIYQGYLDIGLTLITPRDQNGPKKVVSSWRSF